MDNNRHLSTTYSQDTHRYKHGKIDIFRRLSTLFTTFIIMPNLFTITAHISGLIIGAIAEFIIIKFKDKDDDEESIKFVKE